MAYNINADPKQLRSLDDQLKSCYLSIYKSTDNLRGAVEKLSGALDDEAYNKSKTIINKTLNLLDSYEAKFKAVDAWLIDYAEWLEKRRSSL